VLPSQSRRYRAALSFQASKGRTISEKTVSSRGVKERLSYLAGLLAPWSPASNRTAIGFECPKAVAKKRQQLSVSDFPAPVRATLPIEESVHGTSLAAAITGSATSPRLHAPVARHTSRCPHFRHAKTFGRHHCDSTHCPLPLPFCNSTKGGDPVSHCLHLRSDSWIVASVRVSFA
jgi:hypothetical protein